MLVERWEIALQIMQPYTEEFFRFELPGTDCVCAFAVPKAEKAPAVTPPPMVLVMPSTGDETLSQQSADAALQELLGIDLVSIAVLGCSEEEGRRKKLLHSVDLFAVCVLGFITENMNRPGTFAAINETVLDVVDNGDFWPSCVGAALRDRLVFSGIVRRGLLVVLTFW